MTTLSALRLLPPLLLLTLLLPATTHAVRDPFWPIGYAPPEPEPTVPEPEIPPAAQPAPPPEPPPPKPPPVQPITDGDWTTARETLRVSGFTHSTRPDTGETRVFVMINRRSYVPGDTLCVTNQEVEFVWRIASLDNQSLDLEKAGARRLKPAAPATTLQSHQKIQGVPQ